MGGQLLGAQGRMTNFEALAHRGDISATAKGLMLVIVSFGRNGSCRPTKAQLVERSGLAPDALYRRIEELRRAGVLNTHRVRDEKGHIRTAFIAFPPYPEKDGPLSRFC